MQNYILQKILIIPGILLGLTFHEYAHALIADKLGDKTPKFQGRLSLNPMVHIDPIGFILILLIGFGWAKPVQTNPAAYKRKYKDDIKVSVAGPLANLLVAFVFALILGLFYRILGVNMRTSVVLVIISKIFKLTIRINCMLFVFNLIPIPGLDGFHIVRDLFPKVFYKMANFMYQYQMIILIIFVVTPLADYIVGIPSIVLYNTFLKLASLLI